MFDTGPERQGPNDTVLLNLTGSPVFKKADLEQSKLSRDFHKERFHNAFVL
jgi:hypothetical protein